MKLPVTHKPKGYLKKPAKPNPTQTPEN